MKADYNNKEKTIEIKTINWSYNGEEGKIITNMTELTYVSHSLNKKFIIKYYNKTHTLRK